MGASSLCPLCGQRTLGFCGCGAASVGAPEPGAPGSPVRAFRGAARAWFRRQAALASTLPAPAPNGEDGAPCDGCGAIPGLRPCSCPDFNDGPAWVIEGGEVVQ